MSTATDRYVAAVLRSVPHRTRTDIERELRASIGDAIDARLLKGESREAAERAVLTELGDPARLAADYAGPPRHLIGPNVFDAWARTLGVLIAFFVPSAFVLIVAIWVAGGSPLPTAVLTAFGGGLIVGLFVAFSTTVAYAVVDRSDEARREIAAAFGVTRHQWTPDLLPTTTVLRPINVNDAVAAIVGGTLGLVCIFVQRSVSPFSDADGHVIPLLNPSLWSFWMPVMIAIAAVWIATEFGLLARGARSPGADLAVTAVSLASATVYIYLIATGQLFNPAFFDRLGIRSWVEAGSLPMLLLILIAVIDTGTRTVKLWTGPIPRRRSQSEPSR